MQNSIEIEKRGFGTVEVLFKLIEYIIMHRDE